eukprot:GHVL01022495.1.p1 GENE.GHVL01022495.1~~GHVL01022495.1.p1  ORF type:complete len:736 (-),score=124.59 GHVL01022495.1:154-2361(-)
MILEKLRKGAQKYVCPADIPPFNPMHDCAMVDIALSPVPQQKNSLSSDESPCSLTSVKIQSASSSLNNPSRMSVRQEDEVDLKHPQPVPAARGIFLDDSIARSNSNDSSSHSSSLTQNYPMNKAATIEDEEPSISDLHLPVHISEITALDISVCVPNQKKELSTIFKSPPIDECIVAFGESDVCNPSLIVDQKLLLFKPGSSCHVSSFSETSPNQVSSFFSEASKIDHDEFPTDSHVIKQINTALNICCGEKNLKERVNVDDLIICSNNETETDHFSYDDHSNANRDNEITSSSYDLDVGGMRDCCNTNQQDCHPSGIESSHTPCAPEQSRNHLEGSATSRDNETRFSSNTINHLSNEFDSSIKKINSVTIDSDATTALAQQMDELNQIATRDVIAPDPDYQQNDDPYRPHRLRLSDHLAEEIFNDLLEATHSEAHDVFLLLQNNSQCQKNSHHNENNSQIKYNMSAEISELTLLNNYNTTEELDQSDKIDYFDVSWVICTNSSGACHVVQQLQHILNAVDDDIVQPLNNVDELKMRVYDTILIEKLVLKAPHESLSTNQPWNQLVQSFVECIIDLISEYTTIAFDERDRLSNPFRSRFERSCRPYLRRNYPFSRKGIFHTRGIKAVGDITWAEMRCTVAETVNKTFVPSITNISKNVMSEQVNEIINSPPQVEELVQKEADKENAEWRDMHQYEEEVRNDTFEAIMNDLINEIAIQIAGEADGMEDKAEDSRTF